MLNSTAKRGIGVVLLIVAMFVAVWALRRPPNLLDHATQIGTLGSARDWVSNMNWTGENKGLALILDRGQPTVLRTTLCRWDEQRKTFVPDAVASAGLKDSQRGAPTWSQDGNLLLLRLNGPDNQEKWVLQEMQTGKCLGRWLTRDTVSGRVAAIPDRTRWIESRSVNSDYTSFIEHRVGDDREYFLGNVSDYCTLLGITRDNQLVILQEKFQAITSKYRLHELAFRQDAAHTIDTKVSIRFPTTWVIGNSKSSPDGNWVVVDHQEYVQNYPSLLQKLSPRFFSGAHLDRHMVLVGLTSGRFIELGTANLGVGEAAWTADGKAITVARGDALYRVPVEAYIGK